MLNVIDHGTVIEFKTSRTICGRPLYPAHIFYLDGLLIDTGPPHAAGEVRTVADNFPVKQVAITHQHEDHTGNCRFFAQELGIPVYAHPDTIKIISRPPRIPLYRHVLWGAQPPSSALPLGKKIITDRYALDVIHTPGHSTDHTSYFEPLNRWLFCGDLFLGENLTGFMAGENIADHFNSLQKTIALKPSVLFCGLKGRLDQATNRLVSKYKQWWGIGLQVKNLYRSGATKQIIMREVFGREIPFFYVTQSNWGRCYMIDSIVESIHIFDDETKTPDFVSEVNR